MLRSRNANRPRRGEGPAFRISNAFFGWALAFLVLIGFAILSWVGSFYIFGHPEEPFSYKILNRFNKLEPPKRFELSSAPRGEFLGVDELLQRFDPMTARELRSANAELLRNYIRNFSQMKDPVPYITGTFNIMDSYELGGDTVFPAGIVAVAQSTENPRALLELVYTSEPETMSTIHRSLLTGVDVDIQRRRDLTALIHVDRLPDGRLKFTGVPIMYDTYASDFGPGTFSLEPPPSLNLEAGLPVVDTSRLQEADQKHTAYRRRAGLAGAPPVIPGVVEETPEPVETRRLVRVERPRTPPGHDEVPVPDEETEAEPDATPPRIVKPPPLEDVMAAVPPPAQDAAEETTPETETPAGETIEVVEATEPEPEPEAPLQPFPSPTPAPVVATTGGNWPVYAPGRMPRGRLVTVGDMSNLANRGMGDERIYLQGNFVVTASGNERAVLRASGRGGGNVRVIVAFPAGARPPTQNEQVARADDRPFHIERIERTNDGTINVYAREITRP